MAGEKRGHSAALQRWWKESVVYQIYPSSFQDSNGDGWGDIPGITSRLDYLKELGVDIIWCSPMFKSPQADMGYDIADYKDMDRIYGTMDDIDNLFAELKKRDMKMMMDLVVNHTSNEHAWFLESRSSKDNPKRDWYIWKSPKGTDENGEPKPPNNWMQLLGDANSAWTYDKETGEFYLSLFTPEQPDLNWENPEVRAAVWDVMKFWLDRGACGFRMDVINLISKVPGLPDAPINMPPDHKYQNGYEFFTNGPRFHEYMQEMHQTVLSKYDTITVGEMPGISDHKEILRSVGADAGELNMIFIFDIVDIDSQPGGASFTLRQWSARDLAAIVTKWETVMLRDNGWNSLFISNHDQPRPTSRYTDDSDAWREKGAKLLCLMQTTLAGTLYVYQGEELGLRNVPLSWGPEEYKDVSSVNFWKKSTKLAAGDEAKLEQARSVMNRKARDNARVPMQWSGAPNAGFCPEGVIPWMRVNDDYESFNAEREVSGEGEGFDGGMSVFRFYQRALAHRKANADVFVYGGYEQVGADAEPERVFAFLRTPNEAVEGGAGKSFLTVLNFSGDEVQWTMPQGSVVDSWVAGNYGPGEIEKAGEGSIALRPWEGLLGMLK